MNSPTSIPVASPVAFSVYKVLRIYENRDRLQCMGNHTHYTDDIAPEPARHIREMLDGITMDNLHVLTPAKLAVLSTLRMCPSEAHRDQAEVVAAEWRDTIAQFVHMMETAKEAGRSKMEAEKRVAKSRQNREYNDRKKREAYAKAQAQAARKTLLKIQESRRGSEHG